MTGMVFADPAVKRLYYVWVQMRQRCGNPNNHAYKNYGARGIRVCEQWNSFKRFYVDMGLPPGGTTLERTNNNGEYSAANCVWAPRVVQNRNRRDVFLTPEIAGAIRDERAALNTPIRQLAKKYGIRHGNVSKIIHNQQWV